MTNNNGAIPSFDEDLKNLEISDYADDENLLQSDSPKEYLSFYFVLPFVVFFACIIGSCAFPKPTITVFQRSNCSVDSKIMLSMAYLSSWSNIVKSTMSFTGGESGNAIKGELNVTLMRENLLVSQNSAPLLPTHLISANGSTDKIVLFATENVNFDTINISFNGDGKLPETVETSWTYGSPNYSIYTFLTRIILTSILLPFVFGHIVHFFSKSEKPYTTEQTMTAFLSFASILVLDPFFALHYISPSTSHIVIQTAFRDVAFGFLAFYCLGLFSFFGRTAETSTMVSLGFAYIFMVCTIVLIITEDIMRFPVSSPILPQEFHYYGKLSPIHFCIVVVFIISLIVRIAMASSSVKQIHQNRLYIYVIATLSASILLIAFMIVSIFTDKLENSASSFMFSVGLYVMFALFMEWAHESQPDLVQQAYTQPVEGDFSDSNPIGVEEYNDLADQKDI